MTRATVVVIGGTSAQHWLVTIRIRGANKLEVMQPVAP